MSGPLRFLLTIASALILLSANLQAQTVTTAAGGNSPARTVIGPIRGVDYGPFRTGESPSGPCFTLGEVAQDAPILATMGNYVRVYSVAMPYSGQPCDYYDMVLALLAAGLNVVPSAFLCAPQVVPTCGTNNDMEVSYLVSLLNSLSADDLAKIPFVVVGSEPISFNGMTVAQVEAFIGQVRAQVPSVIQVTAAEIYYQYLAPPVVPCQGNNGSGPTDFGNYVDIIYVNIHPYNEGFPLDKAVSCILNVYGSLNSSYPTKPIVISETGWPSHTSLLSGVNDERTFWYSFFDAAAQNTIEYFAFEAFDEMWKGGVEATWGLRYATRQQKFPYPPSLRPAIPAAVR